MYIGRKKIPALRQSFTVLQWFLCFFLKCILNPAKFESFLLSQKITASDYSKRKQACWPINEKRLF